MRSQLVTTAVTALVVGGLSAAGATMIANRDSSESRAVAAPQAAQAKPMIRGASRRPQGRPDPCRKLAGAISRRPLDDASLHKLVAAHSDCRAVLVRSRAPDQTVTVARAVAPQIVTVPAAASSGTAQSVPASSSFHEAEAEGESESGREDAGEIED